MTRMVKPLKTKSPLSALRWALSGCVLFAAAIAGPAYAEYPDRSIQLVLSFPPAGATDILARAIGQKLSEALGQTVIVENKPGGGGIIGLTYAAKAAPDGYTLYLAAVTNAAIAAAAYTPKPVHLIKDFIPVAGIASVPHMLVVPASLPVQNVSQLINLFKLSPGKYNYASQGAGTLSHLESEVFMTTVNLDLVHVPYKGSSQALPDLMSGISSMMFDSIPASMPHVKSGKLRVLAVASNKRVSLLPNVPTVEESGVKGFEANNLFGISAPKGTPAPVLAKLAKAVRTALSSPELNERMQAQGVELKFTPAEEFGPLIDREFRIWGKAVEMAKVKLD
jgi:tripartite-type tricarboxylate transporter receptor subunit TctC